MMTLDGILPFARILLEKCVKEGSIAVDATAGNGYDTLFLAKRVGKNGRVYAFDIQEQAIINTKKRLQEANEQEQVVLISDGHEKLKNYIAKEHFGKIHGAIFNLGYLPGSDKTVTTRPETTIAAVEELLDILAVGGLIVLVIYHGHEEGKIEKEALLKYLQKLPQEKAHVLKYEFINQKNCPPFIIAIEKRM